MTNFAEELQRELKHKRGFMDLLRFTATNFPHLMMMTATGDARAAGIVTACAFRMERELAAAIKESGMTIEDVDVAMDDPQAIARFMHTLSANSQEGVQ